MKHVFTLLLALTCVWAYFGLAHAECCRTNLKLYYTLEDGHCADVGGHKRENAPKACQIYICADGKPLMYYYCGNGSCDIFGCVCEGGCRTGNWTKSFLDNHPHKVITVTDEYW